MKFVIGADHRGYLHKEFIKKNISSLAGKNIEWIDVGCFSSESCDYPEFALAVVKKIKAGLADSGVLLCGSGVGMAIAANRHKGIYAAQVWDKKTARLSKEHDNANIIVIASDFTDKQKAVAHIEIWATTTFLGGKYQNRLQMIDEI
ncbi:RpiB/LacA/LacB family sugar-phosphate isomerase [bacterium]|nr:RpiB/LacA/LacB family sugar-phosphate isomerase [bacterium]